MKKPVLTLESKDGAVTFQVFILMPGEHFERFGGSKGGLTVGKTPSMITREITASGEYDRECDLTDRNVWQHLADAISGNLFIAHCH